MQKKELIKEKLRYWAKRSDMTSHITHYSVSTVLCKKFGALLGNNYAREFDQVCESCLKVYNYEIKKFTVNNSEPASKSEIVAANPDIENPSEFFADLDKLEIGGTWSTGGASCTEITRIS